MSRYIIGIDPGQSGALALLRQDGSFVAVWDAAANDDDCVDLVRTIAITALNDGGVSTKPLDTIAVLEQAQAMPKQGVTSSFHYGVGFGVLRGALAFAGFPRVYVRSGVWKRGLGLTSDKEQCRTRARELWPEASLVRKRDHGRAEALLIAEWWRRQEAGS